MPWGPFSLLKTIFKNFKINLTHQIIFESELLDFDPIILGK